MALSSLTVSKLYEYVDQKRIYKPQDGSTGLNDKYRALSLVLWDLKSFFQLPWDEIETTLTYLDSVIKYSAPDGLDHLISFEPDDFAIKIDHKTPEEFRRMDERGQTNLSAVGIEGGTKTIYLKFGGKHKAITVNSASSYDGNGTWTADTTGSDAANVTTDTVVYKEFSGSVNFDITVTQSANNRATLYNPSMSAVDLADENDKAHFVLDFDIPDKTYITSFDLYWGSDSSATPSTKANYWSKNVTTQINSGAFKNGWNILDFDWSTATKTGSPNAASIKYIEIRINYSASQANDTDFRINNLRVVVPETVDYRYSTAYIAKNSSGIYIDEIGALNDTMLFSGIDTKFMKCIVSGCLFNLFGDHDTKDGQKETQWETRYEADKFKLMSEYPSRVKVPERRIKIA